MKENQRKAQSLLKCIHHKHKAGMFSNGEGGQTVSNVLSHNGLNRHSSRCTADLLQYCKFDWFPEGLLSWDPVTGVVSGKPQAWQGGGLYFRCARIIFGLQKLGP